MTNPGNSRLLLWNERSVVALFAAAFAITVGIFAWMFNARRGIFDPHELPVFYRLFLFEDYSAALLTLLVLVLALWPTMQRLGWNLASICGRNPGPASLLIFIVSAAGSFWIYQRHPLAMDEYVPYMQSKIFIAGHLRGQLPPELLDWLIFPNFQNYFIHVSRQSGEVISAYWPGFALLLVPFTALGVPWLCNPVLAGASTWVIHRLTFAMTGSLEAAGTAILLTIASASFIINAISFYSMTAHLLLNAIFVILLLMPTPARALMAGAVGGLALTLHNPVPHVLFAAPWLVWLAFRSDRFRVLSAIAMGYLPWILIVGFGWQYLIQGIHSSEGSAGPANGPSLVALLTGIMQSVFALPSDALLLARSIGLAKLWLWAVPALVLLALIGFWCHRSDRRFQLLLLSAILTLVGYLLVPLDQGHGWGYRYFHSAWFVLPVLAAAVHPARNAGASRLGDSMPAALTRYSQGLAVASAVLLVPLFAWQVGSFISAHLAQLPSADHGRPRVVVIGRIAGYYAQDLVQNDPFLRDPVIRMFTRGREADRQMIREHFPDLVLLSRTHLGEVWGYASDAPVNSNSE